MGPRGSRQAAVMTFEMVLGGMGESVELRDSELLTALLGCTDHNRELLI